MKNRHSVHLVALLFVMSILVTYGSQSALLAGIALADTKNQKQDSEKSQEKSSVDASVLFELKDSLDKRNAKLTSWEKKLEFKERNLAQKESILKGQISRYEKVIQELQSKLKTQKKGAHDKANKFKLIYEKMDPKKSAKIFNEMDTSLAIDILSTLKQKSTAEILNKMKPEKAREITEEFLGVRKPAHSKKKRRKSS